MGNSNSIRAKRRARGANKEWWRKGPKVPRTIKIAQYERYSNLLFQEFFRSL